VTTENWPKVAEFAAMAEELLIKCEEAAITDEAKTKLGCA